MILTQYRPASISIDDALKTIKFKTYEELINIDFVKSFMEDHEGYKFYKLSVSVSHSSVANKSYYMLMAEYNDGYNWFIVGNLDSDIDFLPRWEYKEKE